MAHWGISFKLKSRLAILSRLRFRSLLELSVSGFTLATVVTDLGIQLQGISLLLLSITEPVMIVNGSLSSHKCAPGVFVPLCLYVLITIVLQSLPECLRPLLWYLILRVFVCLFNSRRSLRSARRHLLNLPKSLCLVKLTHRSLKFVNLELQSSSVKYVNHCSVLFTPVCYWDDVMLCADFLLEIMGPYWFTQGFPCGWGTMIIHLFGCCYYRIWLVLFSRWAVRGVISGIWASFRCFATICSGLQVFVPSLKECKSVQTNWSQLIRLNTWITLCKIQIELDRSFSPRPPFAVNLCYKSSSEDKQDIVSTIYFEIHSPKCTLVDGIRSATCFPFLGDVFECSWWNEGMIIIFQVRGEEFFKFNSQAHVADRSLRVKRNKNVLGIDNYETCYRCLGLILVDLSLCHRFLYAHPFCQVVCSNYLMNWCFASYLGVITPREHPNCYWFEVVCSFNSDIISVADEDIQRGGFEIGLELCFFPYKQLQHFPCGTFVVTDWFLVFGSHQKALATIRYVFPFVLWHHGYIPGFFGEYSCGSHANMLRLHNHVLDYFGISKDFFYTRPIPYVCKQRTDMRIEAGNKVFGTHGSTADYFILLIVFPFGMYWTNLIVLERMYFVGDEAEISLGGVIIHLFTNCNICFSEQHLCVLGMCLRALDVQHRMYGSVHQGRCLKNKKGQLRHMTEPSAHEEAC